MAGLSVSALDHCTVIITDVALAREFYGTRLGLREIAPPKAFDFIAIWYDLNGSYLHLLHKDTPDSESPRHFCLRVTNIQAAREHVRSQGMTIAETVKIPGADRFFVRDPFGNRIEVIEWERVYDPARDGRMRV